MKKKILFLITKSNWGGAQRYVYDLATSTFLEDFYVAVVHGGRGLMYEKLQTVGIRTIDIESLGRDVKIFKDIKSLFLLLKIIYTEKPAILHLNSSKIAVLGALAGRFLRVPRIIFTAHGWAFNEQRSIVQKFLFRGLHILTVLLSHKTIVVSEALSSQLTNNRYIKHKMRVIYNGIEQKDVLSKKGAKKHLSELLARQTAEMEHDLYKSLVIGTIAELHKSKGLIYAIQAFSDVVRTHPTSLYFIIGEGDERSNLESFIHKLGLSKNVFLLGTVSDAYKYFSAFDIFLLPSITESFGYVLLEAGNASLPVIATKVGGVPEVISEGLGMLVNSRDSDALARSIKILLDDDDLRLRYGLALKHRVCTFFDKQRMIMSTIAEYGIIPLEVPVLRHESLIRILVVLPVHNDGNILLESLEKLTSHIVKKIPKKYIHVDVLVSDNASNDNTREIVGSFHNENVDVLYRYTDVKGKGAGVRMGWAEKNYDLYLYTDVDLEYDLLMLENVIQTFLAGQKVIVASRRLRNSQVKRPLYRHFLSIGYNLFLKVLFKNKFSDAQAGFKAIDADIQKLLVDIPEENGYFFDSLLMLFLEKKGFKIYELPAVCSETRPSTLKVLKATAYFLSKAIKLRFSNYLK